MLEVSDAILPVGETVRLREVRDSDFETWASWFNRQSVTQNLPRLGLFPQTVTDQKDWFDRSQQTGRFIAMVEGLEDEQLLGVCSISQIDWSAGTGQVSTVVPDKPSPGYPAGLEARALLTQHAFQIMGLKRLWAGQAFPANLRWTCSQALLGWHVEGFSMQAFSKGNRVSDVVQTSALAPHVHQLIKQRNGSLWPGIGAVRKSLASAWFQRYATEVSAIHQSILELRDCATTIKEQGTS